MWGFREHSGSVVECLTQDQGVAGSSITTLCLEQDIVLVQPRKAHPDITEKLLTEGKGSNQANNLGVYLLEVCVTGCKIVCFVLLPLLDYKIVPRTTLS